MLPPATAIRGPPAAIPSAPASIRTRSRTWPRSRRVSPDESPAASSHSRRSPESSRPPEPLRQVARQSHVHRRVGPERHEIDVQVPAAPLQLLGEALDLFEITLPQRTRVGQELGILLQALEQRCLL